MRTPVVAIVPAAGRSRRFGSQKLLADLDGEPLLDRTLDALLTGVPDLFRVVVVGNGRVDLSPVRRLQHPLVRFVINPDPERGMLSSIQAGLIAAESEPKSDEPAIVVLPGDMPFVRPTTIRTLVAALRSGGDLVVAAHHGRRGHPIGIPATDVHAVRQADPRSSLRDILMSTGARPLLIATDDPGVLRDVDVPGDLAEVSE
jgi:molybdenum cofactor cytidylyltransferase